MKGFPLMLLALLLAVQMVGPTSAITYYQSDFWASNGNYSLIYNPGAAGTNWSTIRDSPTGSAPVEGTYCVNYWATTSTSLGWDYEYRCANSFPTLTLPDSGIVIDEAWYTFYLAAKGTTLGSFNLTLMKFTPAGFPFTSNDFSATTFEKISTEKTAESMSTGRYYSVNITDLSIINTAANTTVVVSNNWTADNQEPVWVNPGTAYLSIGKPTGTNPPKLSVKWHYPLSEGNYSAAWFSDPQLNTQDNPDALNAMFDWIETNKGKFNITAVFGTGDLVNVGTNNTQWQTYISARSRTSVPVYDSMGNHDTASYYTNWTGRNPYWCQTYSNFIIIATPNLTESNYNSDNVKSFIDGTIAANPGKIPLFLTHSYLWNHGELTRPARMIRYNTTAPFFALSGHVENSYGWNRTYNTKRSIYEGLFDFQERVGTASVVLFTFHMDGTGQIDKVYQQLVGVYPTETFYDTAIVYEPANPSLDLSEWHDNFDDLTNFGYYTSKYYEWEVQPGESRLYSNTTTDSYLYNRATFKGGNFTVIWEPVAYDGGGVIYGGLMFGSSTPATKGYDSGTQYSVSLCNQSGTNNQLTLFKTVGSVDTVLNHTHPATVVTGTPYTITVLHNPSASENNIEVYLDGVLTLTSNDKTIGAGYAGPYVQQSGGSYFKEFSVEYIEPTADFTATPTTGIGSTAVQFTDNSTSPGTWNWSYKNQTAWSVFSTSQSPKYTFAPGVYDINLTITNSLGTSTKTETKYLIITPSGGYGVYVKDGGVYGKFPNGTTIASGTAGSNDSAVINAVLTNTSSGDSVYLDSSDATLGEFIPESQITIPRNLVIGNISAASFKWNTGTAVTEALFSIIGTGTGTHNIITDVPVGCSTISLDSTSSLGIADLVEVSDRTVWNPLYSTTWNKSEIHKVQYIGTGTITLTDPTVMSYNNATNNSFIVYITNPIEIHMDGIAINSTDPSTNSHTAIFGKYLIDSEFTNMRINATGQGGILLYNSFNVTVANYQASNLEMSGQGYGVSTADAIAHIRITDANITTCRHAVANGGTGTSPGGQPRNISIERGQFIGYLKDHSQVIDAHAETFELTINGSKIIHPYVASPVYGSYGLQIGAKRFTMTNTTVITNGTALKDRVSLPNCTWHVQYNTFITPTNGFYVQKYGYSTYLGSNDYSTWDYIYFHDNTISGGGTLITVEQPPVITLLDTDALKPIVDPFTTSTVAGIDPLTVLLNSTSRSFIKEDSYRWTVRNLTPGNNTAIIISTDRNATVELTFGNWIVSHSADNEAGINVSTNKPNVSVTASGGSPVIIPSFTTSRNLVIIPQPLVVNDTSTGTVGTWNWSWGDRTENATTMNATHYYTVGPRYATINLEVCNNFGCNQTYRVVFIRRG